MFREMRRKKQELSREETVEILERGSSGVLAVLGDEGYPYAVPISYVWDNGKIYFHCAKAGHKLDAVRGYDKVSFCVIDRDDVKPDTYTTWFRSAIAFGRVRILEQEEEKRHAIDKLARKYAPEDTDENRQKVIDAEWNPLCMLEMSVEHLSGKEAIELVRQKQK